MTAVVFAGGGSGGHIYPAIAIAEALAQRLPAGLDTLFLHSNRPLDAEILQREGRPHAPLAAHPPRLHPVALARFAGSWGPSLRDARAHLRRLQAAHEHVALVATGGFVSPPAVQAARVERLPRLLVNLDAVPGKANRWCARRVDRIATALPLRSARPDPFIQSTGAIDPAAGTPRRRPPFDAELVGPIVRHAARAPADPQQCRRLLGLDPHRPTLLVTGASQGARSLNRFMAAFARHSPAPLATWQILHQSGAADNTELAAAYAAAGVPAVVEPFLGPIGPAWGAADLALARAGAGTVAEAWANAVPALFVPFPGHRDQHQRHNAAPLEAAGAARIADDRRDPHANLHSLGQPLAELLASSPARDRMRAAYAALGPTDGAARVADLLLACLAQPPTRP